MLIGEVWGCIFVVLVDGCLCLVLWVCELICNGKVYFDGLVLVYEVRELVD